MDSIAVQYGFFPKTLWDHPDNSDLKSKRKDPNILAPGDKVVIPDLRIKEVSKPGEARHKFKRKGVPAKLRLKVLKPKDPPPPPEASSSAGDESHHSEPHSSDDKPEFEPIANAPFLIVIDGVSSNGDTDGDGVVEVTIPPGAQHATLRVKPGTPDERRYELDLGSLDPVDSIPGLVKRLNNLSYRCTPDATEMNLEIKDALKRFQFDHQIKTTGELDDATQAKLKEVHGC